MNIWLNYPSFVVYAIAALALCANMMFLWAFSGATRAKTRTAMNEEDAVRFGGSLVPADPPAVARVLRAHSNAQAVIYPFLFLGLLYVLAGGSAGTAKLIFGIFTLARLAHSYAYLKGLQPWRTIFFIVSGIASIALLLDIAWTLIRAA